jgi:hypothetical protein
MNKSQEKLTFIMEEKQLMGKHNDKAITKEAPATPMSEINVECANLLLSTLFHMLNDGILSDYMHYDVV